MRGIIPCLMVTALLVPACHQAGRGDRLDRACAARIRKQLPTWAESEPLSATPIRNRPLGAKRLLLRRDDVVLVVDYAVLRSQMLAFMNAQGAWRYPEEEQILHHLAVRMEALSELDLDDEGVPEAWRQSLQHELADVLEAGAFEVRIPEQSEAQPGSPPRGIPGVILRVDWSYYCGPECGARGRTFVTENCEKLLHVTDMRS